MIHVFIQVAAGSRDLNRYDEKTLTLRGVARVSQPYPYPYGFILGAEAEDGDNLDCYLVTRERVVPGATVACEPVGLLEQREGEEVDHKILAALPGREVPASPALLQELQEFIYAVFADFPQVRVRVGPLRPREEALRHIYTRTSKNRLLFCWNQDDDIANMFSIFLHEHGYFMENVGSLAACLEACQNQEPLLLILCRSLDQPNDGLAFIRTLRSRPDLAYFPIILGEADIPARPKAQGCQEGFQAGANACFGRVYDITDVLGLIKILAGNPMATGLVDR